MDLGLNVSSAFLLRQIKVEKKCNNEVKECLYLHKGSRSQNGRRPTASILSLWCCPGAFWDRFMDIFRTSNYPPKTTNRMDHTCSGLWVKSSVMWTLWNVYRCISNWFKLLDIWRRWFKSILSFFFTWCWQCCKMFELVNNRCQKYRWNYLILHSAVLTQQVLWWAR